MGVDTQQLKGFDDLAAKLRAVGPALRVKAVRNALSAGARLVRDEARASAPVLSKPVPYRTAGLVKKSIVVRSSKTAKRAGDVGVFVNVRPAKGARFRTKTQRFLGAKLRTRIQTRASLRGARSPVDPFYWRFLEFGTTRMRARPFLRRGVRKLPQALTVFQVQLGKWFERANATGKVSP